MAQPALIVILTGLLISPAIAQSVELVSPADAAPGGGTYAEALGQFIRNASMEGDLTAPDGVSLLHIEGDDFTLPFPGPVTVTSIEAMTLDMGGTPHLALLADLGTSEDRLGDVVALAVYALTPKPALIYVVEVGTDRQTGFAASPAVAVGPGDHLLAISNSHGNAGQFYDATTLIALEETALVLVDTVLTLNSHACGAWLTQSLSMQSNPNSEQHWPFTLSVQDKVEPDGEGCDQGDAPAATSTTYTVTYDWDETAGRYIRPDNGWDALYAVTEPRF